MGFEHSDPTRLSRQDYRLQAEGNKLIDLTLETFATKVYALVLRGRVFEAGKSGWCDPEPFTRFRDRPMQELDRLERLARVFQPLDEQGTRRAVVWAFVRGALSLGVVECCLEEKQGYLDYLAPCDSFCRSVADWITRAAANELPTPDFVAYYLGGDLGECIDKNTFSEMACHLAYPFAQADLSVDLAEQIVGYYWRSILTPRLAHEVATEAVAQARTTRAAGAGVPPG